MIAEVPGGVRRTLCRPGAGLGCWFCILASLLDGRTDAWGEEAAPSHRAVVVVTIPPGQALHDALSFLGASVQNPSLPENARRAWERWSGHADLPGFDAARPTGLVLWTDGIDLRPQLLVPVNDGGDFLNALKRWVDVQPVADNVYQLKYDRYDGFAQVGRDWIVLGQTDQFAAVEELVSMLALLESEELLRAEFRVRDLPEAYRTMAVDRLRDSLRDQPGFAERLSPLLAQEQLRPLWLLLESCLADCRLLSLSVRLDQQQKQLGFKLTAIPETGTSLERWVQSLSTEIPPQANPPLSRKQQDAAKLPPVAVRGRFALPPLELRREDAHRLRSVLLAGFSDRASAALQTAWADVLGEHPAWNGNVEVWLEARRGSIGGQLHLTEEGSAARLVARAAQLPGAQTQGPQAAPTAVKVPLPEEALTDTWRAWLGQDVKLSLQAVGVQLDWRLGAIDEPPVPLATAKDWAPFGVDLRFSAATWADGFAQRAEGSLATAMSIAALNLHAADDEIHVTLLRRDEALELTATAHEGCMRTLALGLGFGVLQLFQLPR